MAMHVDSGLEPSRPWTIGATAFVILVLELALIRLIPAEIKAISYFTNLILFASFFGLGVGSILHDVPLPKWLFPTSIFSICLYLYVSRGLVVYEHSDTVHFWLQGIETKLQPLAQVPLFVSASIVFLLVSSIFVPLGHGLAGAISREPRRLQAYGWDLGGSLAGTMTFAATSYLGLSPVFWLIGGPIAFAFVLPFGRDMRVATTIGGLSFVFLTLTASPTIWSPYYLLNYFQTPQNLTVFVNSSFHQEAINFDSKDPSYQKIASGMLQKFGIPYDIYRQYHGGAVPEKVLILGAGTGNDVYIARANRAPSITAVEIDPSILELGQKANAAQPYSHPDVQVVVDDARHFLQRTSETYDLIVFGTLDSQTLLSGHSNLRLDNYVYTQESFADARQRLRSGGMLATYYSVFKPWFFGRIYSTVAKAFPKSLRMVRFEDNYLFNTIIMAAKDIPSFISDPLLDETAAPVIPSHDDWPFIYMENPVVSPLYLKILAMIVAAATVAFALLVKKSKTRQASPALFLMGVGFTLMESAAIVRLSLLFGATWIVSTIVFASALVMMLIGNVWVDRAKPPILYCWIGLLSALFINIIIAPSSLLPLAQPLQLFAVILMVGTPVLCASMCFSDMFRQQKVAGYALGINLIGAMLGGALEYVSMWLGMTSVWYVILGVYASAAVLWRLFQ